MKKGYLLACIIAVIMTVILVGCGSKADSRQGISSNTHQESQSTHEDVKDIIDSQLDNSIATKPSDGAKYAFNDNFVLPKEVGEHEITFYDTVFSIPSVFSEEKTEDYWYYRIYNKSNGKVDALISLYQEKYEDIDSLVYKENYKEIISAIIEGMEELDEIKGVSKAEDVDFCGLPGQRWTTELEVDGSVLRGFGVVGFNSSSDRVIMIMAAEREGVEKNWLDYCWYTIKNARLADNAKAEEEANVNNTDSLKQGNPQPANGIRPEFKAAMDSYEEFFDEYIAFLKKMENSDNPLEWYSDYMQYMTKYSEAMEGLESMESEDMTNEETLYYLEVTSRINQKLLAAAG